MISELETENKVLVVKSNPEDIVAYSYFWKLPATTLIVGELEMSSHDSTMSQLLS